LGGVRCDPQSKLRWFSGKLLLIIPNRKRFRAQEKCHFFRLAGREGAWPAPEKDQSAATLRIMIAGNATAGARPAGITLKLFWR